MSVKKSLVLAAAGIVASLGATAAVAGGPDVPAAPAWSPYIYIEADLGYADSNWNTFFGSPFATATSNGVGGFTVGGLMGYMFTRYLGIEGGWFYLPCVQGSAGILPAPLVSPFNPAAGNVLNLNSWFAYIAGKVMVPIYDGLMMFGKFGIAYRNLRWTGTGAGAAGTNGYWAPIFAAGMLYHFGHHFSINFQYMYLPGHRKFFGIPVPPVARRAPTAQLFTMGFAYAFQI